MHHTAPLCFTDDVVCFGSWAAPSLLHTFFFLSFWYRSIFNFNHPKNIFQKWFGFFFRCFLAKSNQALYAPCGETSVFALVKSSLDCRLWQWHAYLLESVLLLAGCCERVFLYHEEDPPIIHHCCSLWTSRPFYVAELISAFFFYQNEPNCWFGQFECSCDLSNGFVLFLKSNNCLFHLHGEVIWLHDVRSQQQLPHANDTLRINPRPFTCLFDLEITIWNNHPEHAIKWLLSQLSNYSWKGGGGVHSCNSLTFPPIVMRISLH